MRRVTFLVDHQPRCEYLHHKDSVVAAPERCECGKYVCTQCRTPHLNSSLQHRCHHIRHLALKSDGCEWGLPCSCGRCICLSCRLDHFQTSEQHQCDCPYHDRTNGLWGERCSCDKNICEECQEVHFIYSKFHATK